MITHLFKDFLKNEKVYKKNIDFWKTIVYTLLSVDNLTFSSYLQTTKKDGSVYLDGNPIYNFKINESNRAVRIIQEEIETENVEFSAWLNSMEVENENIEELVISLELSNESTLFAIELINAWTINEFPKEKMEKYIDKTFALKDLIFQPQLEDETLMKEFYS